MHPKLIFDERCFKVIRNGRFQYHQMINRIPLQHIGPIAEFSLDLSHIIGSRFSYVDQWRYFLSRNGFKKLTLVNLKQWHILYNLPSYAFSYPSLEHWIFIMFVSNPIPLDLWATSLLSLIRISFTYQMHLYLHLERQLTKPKLEGVKLFIEQRTGKEKLFWLINLLGKIAKNWESHFEWLCVSLISRWDGKYELFI